MNPFDSNTLQLVFVFFVPGFITLKVFDRLVPTERRDFSKDLFEAIGLSCINFALLFWPIYIIYTTKLSETNPFLFYLSGIGILFIAPVLWAVGFSKLIARPFFRKRIIDPTLKPWDRLFSERRAYWVIVHMNGGASIGGKYGKNSFASSYPAEEQIYLEEVWQIDQMTGKFLSQVPRTHGLIISRKDYVFIEFLR